MNTGQPLFSPLSYLSSSVYLITFAPIFSFICLGMVTSPMEHFPPFSLHPFMSMRTALRTAFTVSIHLSPRLIHVTSFFLRVALRCFTRPRPVSFMLSHLHCAALRSTARPWAISIVSPRSLTVRSWTCHVNSLQLRAMSLEYIS
jgi:hypothetical protein